MSVKLESAFVWTCPECGTECFEKADIGEIDGKALGDASQHFETLDATGGDEERESPYLVARVVCGPAFVKCVYCLGLFAASLPEVEDD